MSDPISPPDVCSSNFPAPCAEEGPAASGVQTAPAGAPLVSHELRVLQAIRRIIRAIDLYSRRLAARHRVTTPQLLCLLAVAERAPVPAVEIARSVHLSPSTVNGILDRLEGKALVQRSRDPRDRRLVRVTLTEAGRALVDTGPSPLQDTLADHLRVLPEPERAEIAGALERVVELMEARGLDAAPILATGPITPPDSPPPG